MAKPKLLLLNETISPSGCIFRCACLALGSSVSRENLVARIAAIAEAGCKLFGERCCRRNPLQSDGDNNAPLARGLLDWTRNGTPAWASDGALETVSRHDWNPRPRLTDVAQRLLGASGSLVVRPDRSGDAFRSGDGNPLVGSHRN